MTSRERILAALNHVEPDRVPVDLSGHRSSGIAAMTYPKLRRCLGIEPRPIRVYDVIQQLAIVDDDVLDRFGIDCIEMGRGFALDEDSWKPWTLPDGTDCLIPAWTNMERRSDRWVILSDSGQVVAHMPDGTLYFEQTYFPLAESDNNGILADAFDECMWTGIASPPGPVDPQMTVRHRLDMDGEDAVLARLYSRQPRQDGARLLVPMYLAAPNGSGEIVHAETGIVFASQLEEVSDSESLPDWPAYPLDGSHYDSGRLFHGPALQAVKTVDGMSGASITGIVKTAPSPSEWIRQPWFGSWITDPMVLDGAFQLVILWCQAQHGIPALPVSIEKYRQFSSSIPGEHVRVVVRVTEPESPKIKADIDILNLEGKLLARMIGVVCFESESLVEAYRNNRLETLFFPMSPDSGHTGGQWERPRE